MNFALLFLLLFINSCGNVVNNEEIKRDSEKISETSLRIDILNEIFIGMLEQEKKERIASDQEILNQFTLLKTNVTEQLNSVDLSIKAINNNLTTLANRGEQFSMEIKKIENNTNELEKKIGVKILDNNASLLSNIKESKDEFLAKLALVDDKLSELGVQSNLNTKNILDNRQSIVAVISSQVLFENYVSQTYATKNELDVQKELYKNLELIVKNLDLRITRSSEEIRESLGQKIIEISSKINSIESKVSSQGKTIEEMKHNFEVAIEEYKTGSEFLSKQLRDGLENTKNQIGIMLLQKNHELRNELLNELNQQSLQLTLYTNKSLTLFSNGIAELSRKVDKNNEEQKLSIDNIRKELVDAISLEQQERKQLGRDIQNLIARVIQFEQNIKDAEEMSKQNLVLYQRINSNFELEKIKVAERFSQQTNYINEKFEDIKKDLETRLKDLGSYAEKLVANLGEDVKQNFKAINLDIAVLSNRQANAEKRLETFLTEYQTDRSRSSNFSARIAAPFRRAQGGLASAIDSLTSIQLRFVEVLAPDDENPDFYNEDLKKRLSSLNKKCDPENNSKIVNIYGLDSFQLISIEYVRLLLLGLRSGNKYTDKIFFNYGAAGSNRLDQAILVALLQTPSSDVDSSCKYEVQQWARGIILNDTRFSLIADRLADDEELERAISVFYGIFQEIESPLSEIQTHIEYATLGIRDVEAARDSMIRQTALDLVNAAWDARQIADRLALVSDIEKIQTAQNNESEEIKNEFRILHDKLNEFKEQTNTRLVRLEEQQGKMTLSMKRALDVLISLADRGGYEDLKSYARWAGDPISYTPVIFPNWSPKITMVQHFFGGKLSLKNSSDACSGTKILSTGGIGGAFQFGTWGPCWVNFRNIPLPSWGNEFNTLWLRIFGAGHIIRIKVAASDQKERQDLFRDYKYDRLFDFRIPNQNIKLWGSFDNGVFDIKVPDLLDYYLKNIRTWGGVTVAVQSIREDSIGSEIVQKTSNIFKYTIQCFSPLILDLHKAGLPKTLSFDKSKVKMNFVSDHNFERTGWVSGYEAAFLVRNFLKIGTVIEKKHLFAEGQSCKNFIAKNGFESLSCLDSNKNLFFDKNDLEYKNVYAFFDYNTNGIVDFGELSSLSSLNVERISLSYKTIPEKMGLQNGNDLRYQSSSFGKGLVQNYKVIDIYFGVEK